MIIIVYFIVESLKKKWRDKNLDWLIEMRLKKLSFEYLKNVMLANIRFTIMQYFDQKRWILSKIEAGLKQWKNTSNYWNFSYLCLILKSKT
jgi:hypothetical protein